tara:strand:- start:528 stop:1469 length:942 start_codon:yes stop_codon:yes gene_type:complete
VIKIKKIFFLIFVFFISIDKADAEINDSLFMTIGNKPITQSDLVNEIKIILILNNESYSNEKRDRLQEVAIKSTIKRTIKEIEIERHNFYRFSDEELQKELARLAGNIFVDIETLKNICASNNLDFSIIENQIKTELHWNSLIFELYKNRITVDADQIEERLKILQNKKKLEEYLISEIVIKNVEKNKLDNEIKELKNKIDIEGFENVAKNLSISESSIKGGDLGWVNENILSENVKSVLINTQVGSISEPIILPEGILIFKIREKREIDSNLSLEQIKNQLVNSEKNKILNMHSLSHYDKVRRSVSINFYNK